MTSYITVLGYWQLLTFCVGGNIDPLAVGAFPSIVGGVHIDGVLCETGEPVVNQVVQDVAVDDVTPSSATERPPPHHLDYVYTM